MSDPSSELRAAEIAHRAATDRHALLVRACHDLAMALTDLRLAGHDAADQIQTVRDGLLADAHRANADADAAQRRTVAARRRRAAKTVVAPLMFV